MNVKELRTKLNLSQVKFSSTYKIKLSTLRNWEQGRRKPRAWALNYLLIIAAFPEKVAEVIKRAY